MPSQLDKERIFDALNIIELVTPPVCRAGILYINPGDLGWNPYVTSWIETRDLQHEKANLTILFDKYIPSMQEAIKHRFKKITPIPEIAHVESLCSLLECIVVPANVPSGLVTTD